MDRARIPYVTASLADGLRRLMELREEGVLTGEEFEAAKPGMFPFSPTQLREEIDPHRLPRRNTQPQYHQPNPLDG